MKKGKKNGKRLRLKRRRARRALYRQHPELLAQHMAMWTIEVEHGPVYVQG